MKMFNAFEAMCVLEDWEKLSQSINIVQGSQIFFQHINRNRREHIIISGKVRQITIEDSSCNVKPAIIIFMFAGNLQKISGNSTFYPITGISFPVRRLETEGTMPEFIFSNPKFFDGRPFTVSVKP